MNMLYLAYFTGEKRNIFNSDLLAAAPNELSRYVPNGLGLLEGVRVIRTPLGDGKPLLYLNANSVDQVAALYRGN